ncbi:hypothetical protein FQN54_006725 [Arachnomyces sp. PD_36]|nr:hypothetical protein FQN54_006725 [Arachnomyces sp. PD_36]
MIPLKLVPVRGQVSDLSSRLNPLRTQNLSICSLSCHCSSPDSSVVPSQPITRGFSTGIKRAAPPVIFHSEIKHSARLADRTCLITGGTSGIGYAIAERFLQEGARNVVITGRSKGRLQAAMEGLHESILDPNSPKTSDKGQDGSQDPCQRIEFSPRIAGLIGDVGLAQFWASESCKTAMSGLDILVNCAGVSHASLLMRAEDDHIDSMLKTNLQGAIFATREMARRVPRQLNPSKYSKSIINISSLLAFKGAVGTATYATTKAGLIALTRCMAVEGSKPVKGMRIRCNAITPGYIETRILKEIGEPARANALESIPLDRFGTPEEVADAAVFLATNEYANNCILNIDGGLGAI